MLDTDSVSVIVNALPEIPTISQNGNQLTSTSAVSYQWYLDDSMICGATSQTYDATVSGSYQVEITDANACSEILHHILLFLPLSLRLIMKNFQAFIQIQPVE